MVGEWLIELSGEWLYLYLGEWLIELSGEWLYVMND
jgi:hypothetical protein